MPRGEPDIPIPGDDEPEEGSRRAALLALLVIAALVVGGVFLWDELARVSSLQDCVAQGRTNCVPIATPTPR